MIKVRSGHDCRSCYRSTFQVHHPPVIRYTRTAGNSRKKAHRCPVKLCLYHLIPCHTASAGCVKWVNVQRMNRNIQSLEYCGLTAVNYIDLKNGMRMCIPTACKFHMFSYSIRETISKTVSTLCKFELDATASMSLQRSKDRAVIGSEMGRKRGKTAQSNILSHHLPTAELAACTLDMSSGQAAAKMLETTSRLWLTLHINIPAHMYKAHTYAHHLGLN